MDNELIQKIEKLLRLANSSNEHEAKLAAAKAYELLERHNLRLAESGVIREFRAESAEKKGRKPPEWRWITPILNRYFHVIPVLHRERRGPGPVTLKLIGTTANATIAKYVCVFLTRSYRRCWASYSKRPRVKHRQRQAYYKGLMLGVMRQLEDQRAAMGLASLPLDTPDDPLLLAAVKYFFPNTTSRMPRKIPNRMSNALMDGYWEGQNLRLRKAVEAPTESSGLALPHFPSAQGGEGVGGEDFSMEGTAHA